MRNYLFALILLFSLSISAQEIQLTWNEDFNVAMELAKTENKPVLIYFTNSDCTDCQQFYSDFFEHQDFNKLSLEFIMLRLDTSNYDAKNADISAMKQKRMSMHYNKSSTFPAVLVVDTDGRKVNELFTSLDKVAITSYLNFLKSL